MPVKTTAKAMLILLCNNFRMLLENTFAKESGEIPFFSPMSEVSPLDKTVCSLAILSYCGLNRTLRILFNVSIYMKLI